MGKNNYFTHPCENEIFKRKKLKLPLPTNYPFHEHHVLLQRWQIEKINLLKPMPKYCTQTWIALRILYKTYDNQRELARPFEHHG